MQSYCRGVGFRVYIVEWSTVRVFGAGLDCEGISVRIKGLGLGLR